MEIAQKFLLYLEQIISKIERNALSEAWSTPYCQARDWGTAKSVHTYRHMLCSAQFLSCHQWRKMCEFSDGELAIIAITPWGLAQDWNVANSRSHARHVPCQAHTRQNVFWFDSARHG